MADDDEDTSFPPPRNMSEDIEDMKIQTSNVLSFSDDPLVGVLSILTAQGHYDFLINSALANEMIQNLREFLRGDSESLLDDE